MVTNSILTSLVKSTGKEKKTTTTLLRVMASLPTGAVLDVTEVLHADQQSQHQQLLVPFRSIGVNLIILQTNFYLLHTTNTIRQLKVKINSFWNCPEKRLLYLNSVGKLLKAKLNRISKQVLHLKWCTICQVRKKYHNFFLYSSTELWLNIHCCEEGVIFNDQAVLGNDSLRLLYPFLLAWCFRL